MSEEHIKYLKKLRKDKVLVVSIKIFILVGLLIIWEVLVRSSIISEFLLSSPSKILETIIELFRHNNLLSHVIATTNEVLIGFFLSSLIAIIISTFLWWNKKTSLILDPYLTVLNSLPKVSLGPLIIIICGANIKSIIIMAVLISVFTTIINMYTSFVGTDYYKITLMKSLKASKIKIFYKLVLRSNLKNIISALKINIGLTLIGVIMGELLVSKKGLGYLITYGSQIFNLNLVITAIVILGIISFLCYKVIDIMEKKIN